LLNYNRQVIRQFRHNKIYNKKKDRCNCKLKIFCNLDLMNKYQAIISFDMDEEFMSLVPPHRTYINYLLNKGVIETYTVSMETQQSWIVVNANTKVDVEEVLKASPLHKYWSMEIVELFVYDSQSNRLPAVQLN
jgi:hypothetical protein